MKQPNPRIMLYSHDTYGLGHLRRSLNIATQLSNDIKNAHQLLVTGSMVAGAFSLPPRLDLIKLPALSKRSTGAYTPRTLPLSLQQTISWREQMILQAVDAFQPDLFLVDKSPAGVHGELLPTLEHLRRWQPDTKIVLGMRDIEDCPSKTQAEWAASGVYELFEETYDHILYYGQRSFFDPVLEYWLTPQAEEKLIECGYLGTPNVTHDTEQVRRELGIGKRPFILVTVGGGGDGYNIIRTYLDMIKNYGDTLPFHSVIVTGPLMAAKKQALIEQAFPSTSSGAALPNVSLRQFIPNLPAYIAAADLVVSMAGYNTVCETLSLNKRAVLIPRMRVRAEQRMRAERLARYEAAFRPGDTLSETVARLEGLYREDRDSGHMAPYVQPRRSLHVFASFLAGTRLAA